MYVKALGLFQGPKKIPALCARNFFAQREWEVVQTKAPSLLTYPAEGSFELKQTLNIKHARLSSLRETPLLNNFVTPSHVACSDRRCRGEEGQK